MDANWNRRTEREDSVFCGYTYHHCNSTGFLSNACLFDVDNVHDDPTLEHLGESDLKRSNHAVSPRHPSFVRVVHARVSCTLCSKTRPLGVSVPILSASMAPNFSKLTRRAQRGRPSTFLFLSFFGCPRHPFSFFFFVSSRHAWFVLFVAWVGFPSFLFRSRLHGSVDRSVLFVQGLGMFLGWSTSVHSSFSPFHSSFLPRFFHGFVFLHACRFVFPRHPSFDRFVCLTLTACVPFCCSMAACVAGVVSIDVCVFAMDVAVGRRMGRVGLPLVSHPSRHGGGEEQKPHHGSFLSPPKPCRRRVQKGKEWRWKNEEEEKTSTTTQREQKEKTLWRRDGWWMRRGSTSRKEEKGKRHPPIPWERSFRCFTRTTGKENQ